MVHPAQPGELRWYARVDDREAFSAKAQVLFVPAPACALEIGARLPVQYGEEIVVRNDGTGFVLQLGVPST